MEGSGGIQGWELCLDSRPRRECWGCPSTVQQHRAALTAPVPRAAHSLPWPGAFLPVQQAARLTCGGFLPPLYLHPAMLNFQSWQQSWSCIQRGTLYTHFHGHIFLPYADTKHSYYSTMDKDTDPVGQFLEVPLLTYNHICCSPEVIQTKSLSATCIGGCHRIFLHEDARTRGCMWDPPASTTPSPHTPHTATVDMQGTIQLLSSSPPAAGLGQWHLCWGIQNGTTQKSDKLRCF